MGDLEVISVEHNFVVRPLKPTFPEKCNNDIMNIK